MEKNSENIISYADDTAVITTGKNWSEIEEKMNNELNDVAYDLILNKLSLNTDKTVYLEFGNNCNSISKNMNIKIHDRQILRAENTKYLGIIFDSHMRWDNHTNYVFNKTKYLTYLFYKLSNIMTTEILNMLYYAFFNSIVTYGIIAWGGAYPGRLKQLQNLQNRLLKIVNKNKFIHGKYPLNIDQLFTYESILYHHKELKDQYENSDRNTRNKSILLPRRNKTISIKYSYIRAIVYYNKLPKEMKILKITKSSKTKIKKWILENSENY